MESPARLHVLLARQSRQAIVLRRGPSKQTAVIGWDRATDRFVVGQWLGGRIYGYRSDLSPDGRHWIYLAMGGRGETWTAVAKTPYLKALDFYPKQDAWNGGGLFESDTSYWLNEPSPADSGQSRHTSGLSVLPQWNGEPSAGGECPAVYFPRLFRDGWQPEPETGFGENEIARFSKRVNNHWQLRKSFYAGGTREQGQGVYREDHALFNPATGEQQLFPDMEWADLDKSRLVWAEHGKVMAGRVTKQGLQSPIVLFDTNPLAFEELKAPY